MVNRQKSNQYIKVHLSELEKRQWNHFAKEETSFGTVSSMVRHAVKVLMQNPELITNGDSLFSSQKNANDPQSLQDIREDLKAIRSSLELLLVPSTNSKEDILWNP